MHWTLCRWYAVRQHCRFEMRKGLKYCNRKSHHITDVTKAVAVEDAERRAEIQEYADHKESFAKNIQFDGKRANKSKQK